MVESGARLYVYKEYNDEYAYGEEVVELYSTKEKAMERLREAVEEAFKCSWNDIPEEVGLDDMDTFEEDYVSINNGDGATAYFVIEEKEVQ